MAQPLSNTSRFTLARNLQEWMATEKEPAFPLLGNYPWTKVDKNFSYSGDPDFAKFMKVPSKDLATFEKFYPNLNIFLQNLHWTELFDGVAGLIPPTLQNAASMLSKKKTEKILTIVRLFPLESAIFGEALKEAGGKNVIYNFNRTPAVNSTSKTFEATIFLELWKNIPELAEKVRGLAKIIQDSKLALDGNRWYVLFDENDAAPNWNVSKVDPYVKSSIAFKEWKFVYRVDEYPSKEWLLSKDIKQVVICDMDNTPEISMQYKTIVLGDDFPVETFHIPYQPKTDTIGWYEDYVVGKNREYVQYRKDILDKVKDESVSRVNIPPSGTNLPKAGKVSASANSKNINAREAPAEKPTEKKEIVFFLGSLGVIFALVVMYDLRGGQGWFTNGTTGSGSTGSTTSSSGWRFNPYVGNSTSIFGGGGGTSSSSIGGSKSTTSSSISSFGGGGFSKGGG
jgi:hypothetical protein